VSTLTCCSEKDGDNARAQCSVGHNAVQSHDAVQLPHHDITAALTLPLDVIQPPHNYCECRSAYRCHLYRTTGVHACDGPPTLTAASCLRVKIDLQRLNSSGCTPLLLPLPLLLLLLHAASTSSVTRPSLSSSRTHPAVASGHCHCYTTDITLRRVNVIVDSMTESVKRIR